MKTTSDNFITCRLTEALSADDILEHNQDSGIVIHFIICISTPHQWRLGFELLCVWHREGHWKARMGAIPYFLWSLFDWWSALQTLTKWGLRVFVLEVCRHYLVIIQFPILALFDSQPGGKSSKLWVYQINIEQAPIHLVIQRFLLSFYIAKNNNLYNESVD